MLSENLEFNYRSIRSFTSYACQVDDATVEREISFHVNLGPSHERRGDCFPVHQVPQGRMAWLSDWSFNTGGPLNRAVSVGGSLGRITAESQYIYVLNCSVSAGEMRIFSPSRPIRYLANEWLSVCFHHMGEPLDLPVRATFRFTEVPGPKDPHKTEVFSWWEQDQSKPFPGPA